MPSLFVTKYSSLQFHLLSTTYIFLFKTSCNRVKNIFLKLCCLLCPFKAWQSPLMFLSKLTLAGLHLQNSEVG